MAKYCNRCKTVYDDACPRCGDTDGREATAGDECFLTEKDTIWSEALSDMLRQNGIPFWTVNTIGSAMAMYLPRNERIRFFVPYEYLDSAREIVDSFCSVDEE